MIGAALRPVVGRIADPLVNRLLAWGVTPNAVTATGTVGVTAAALVFFPRGSFLVGTLVITLFVLTDTIDGALARKREVTSAFGGWLDSTCDRVADGAVFVALAWWFSNGGQDRLLAAVSLFCLVSGAVVSYEKARAEGLGMRCDVGLAERAERLVLALAGTALVGLGAPDVVLTVALWVLAAATAFTVAQRALEVRRQAALVP